jgi:mannan polymerase II complex MNN10 subunit
MVLPAKRWLSTTSLRLPLNNGGSNHHHHQNYNSPPLQPVVPPLFTAIHHFGKQQRPCASEPTLYSALQSPQQQEEDDTETMAVSMENPQDPEHAIYVQQSKRYSRDVRDEEKHASKYPKKRSLRTILFRPLLVRQSKKLHYSTTQVTAFVFSVIGTVFLLHRFLSLYMSHRHWINAPITYMTRQCSSPNFATLLHPAQEEVGKICITTLTDARRHSTTHHFVRWRNFDGILELTWENKLHYAQKHNYFLYDASDHMDTSRPPAWSKIKAVQYLLQEEQCDWVMWTDADTVIMNSDKKIENFLPADPTKDLLVGSDNGGGYNLGVFVVRNSAWSQRFLTQWWNMESFVNPPGLSLSGDNHALKALLRDMVDLDAHVLSPARCTFNSFAKFLSVGESASVMDTLDEQPWYQSEDYYHMGDFLAHTPGYDNKESCLRLLLQEAK